MKLAVIGEPCMDYIHRGSETTEKQFGGILYSLVSFKVYRPTVYLLILVGRTPC